MTSAQSKRLNNGELMPTIGLGTFDAREDVMRATLRHALKSGYRSLDTAYFYLNEDVIGDELQEWFSKGKLKREDLFVTSKLPPIGFRRNDAIKFLKMTLADLKLDYLDLYLVHHPFAFKSPDVKNIQPMDEEGNVILDHDIVLEELWKEMEDLVDTGLVKSIGISNFNSEQIRRIMKVARIPPACHQVEAHVYMQQRPLKKLCDEYGIAVSAYGPLGAPYREQEDSDECPLLIKHPKVLHIANEHSKTPGQVLLKFLLQKDFIVLPKSATPSRIEENIQLFDFELTENQLKQLEQLDRGEKGRVLTFKEIFPGIERHKEYPFHIPF